MNFNHAELQGGVPGSFRGEQEAQLPAATEENSRPSEVSTSSRQERVPRTSAVEGRPNAPRSSIAYLIPSVRDIVFIFLFWSLLAGTLSNRPLADPDIGWHIRTGELMLVDARDSARRSFFVDHAWPTVVCLGVALRSRDRNPASHLRTQRRRVAVCADRRGDIHDAAVAIAQARNRTVAGDCAHAARRSGCDHSLVCAAPHCELVLYACVVCRA